MSEHAEINTKVAQTITVRPTLWVLMAKPFSFKLHCVTTDFNLWPASRGRVYLRAVLVEPTASISENVLRAIQAKTI